MNDLPYLGYGLGLRREYYREVLETLPKVDWFEILTENYLVAGGKPKDFLMKIRQHYPMVMHGVSMSIGSSDALNFDYLKQLKALAKEVEPEWISDHLCWTGFQGINAHDLLPLPYSEEAINHVVSRIQTVQEYLGRPILIENVSSYINFSASEMTEWEFLARMAKSSGCYLLLDINNIYVSAFNHNFDPKEYINNIDVKTVKQFHLAGHTHCGTHIIDTHDEPVVDDVWQLFQYASQRFGKVSTMIERDDNMPPLDELLLELEKAKKLTAKTPLNLSEENGATDLVTH